MKTMVEDTMHYILLCLALLTGLQILCDSFYESIHDLLVVSRVQLFMTPVSRLRMSQRTS